MNNTTKEKYLLAEKMLKGRIPVEEVALMTGLEVDKLKEMEEALTPKETKGLASINENDNVDFKLEDILFDSEGDTDIL